MARKNAANAPAQTSAPAGVAADGSPPVESRPKSQRRSAEPPLRSSALIDTRVIYCGDNLEQLRKLPPACVDQRPTIATVARWPGSLPAHG